MKSSNRHSTLHQAGFTLVEIMVGLVIGMFATLIIMQVFSVFEAQKRTTTGTADAQTNGSIALYNITREIEMAGYPLIPTGKPGTADSAIECATLTIDGVADATLPNRLTPVAITNSAGPDSSDSIIIRYGSSLEGGIPVQITGNPAPSITLAAPAMDVPVSSNVGCRENDRVLIFNNAGTCAMSNVPASGVTGATTVILENNTAPTAVAPIINANLACLGRWNEITYAVNNGNLERNGEATIAGIVNIQAQYGISSAANSNQVDQWVEPSGAWATPSVANRNRIKAVRIAVVARNAKRESDNVTTGVTAWTGSASAPAPTITLSNDADGTSWQRYRYRVFETIVPLRNVIWSQRTL